VSEVKMKIKRNITVVIIILLALALIVLTGCARAEFQLSPLEVSPSKVATGDTAVVKMDVTNVGEAEGIYTATLIIDGVPAETKDMTIPPGTTEKVTFTVVKEVVDVYTVEIGGLGGTLHVVKPAEFQLSSLVVPREVVLGDEVTLTVDVGNVGGLEGRYVCTLLIDGAKVQTKALTLTGEASDTVSFTFTAEELGTHQMAVGDLIQPIKVLKPAEFKLDSLVMSSHETVAGSSVTVTVDIANIGEAEGGYTVTLKLNGEEVESREVTLAGGETETVRFTVAKDTVGIYDIEVNGLVGTLAVSPTPPAGYKGYADWENGFFIAYPEGWEQVDLGDLVDFQGPMEEGSQPAVGVTKESLAQLTTSKEYVESAVEMMKSLFQGFKVISIEEVTINNIPATKATCTWPVFGVNTKMQFVALIRDKIGFSIVSASLLATYDEYADTFDTVVNSFMFLP